MFMRYGRYRRFFSIGWGVAHHGALPPTTEQRPETGAVGPAGRAAGVLQPGSGESPPAPQRRRGDPFGPDGLQAGAQPGAEGQVSPVGGSEPQAPARRPGGGPGLRPPVEEAPRRDGEQRRLLERAGGVRSGEQEDPASAVGCGCEVGAPQGEGHQAFVPFPQGRGVVGRRGPRIPGGRAADHNRQGARGTPPGRAGPPHQGPWLRLV